MISFKKICFFILSITFTRFVFAGEPQNVTHSNILSSKITISWITETSETGYVNYGTTATLGNTDYDQRGNSYSGKTHYVNLNGLATNVTLYYDIVSGETTYDNNGNHYIVNTAPKLNPSLISDTVYGRVFMPDGTTYAEGTIAFLKIKDNDGNGDNGESALYSNLITSAANGNWFFDLKNIYTTSLNAFFSYSDSGDNIVINVIGPNLETGSLTVDTANDTPASPITLTANTAPALEWTGESNYIDKGLFPETGYGATDFIFRIKYKDADNDAPAEHKLYLDKNGDNDYSDAGEILDMSAAGTDYINGVIYTHTTKIPYSANGINCSYYFSFSDGKVSASADNNEPVSAAGAVNKPDIRQTLSVTIDKTSWQLSEISAGSNHITDTAHKVKVTNAGDGTQTYSLQITNPGQWTASSTKDAGMDTFSLSAVFTETSKTNVDTTYFNEIASDDVIPSTNTPKATITRFGSSKASENGALITPNGERNLWFEFQAPNKDTKGGEQSVEVTITAHIP